MPQKHGVSQAASPLLFAPVLFAGCPVPKFVPNSKTRLPLPLAASRRGVQSVPQTHGMSQAASPLLFAPVLLAGCPTKMARRPAGAVPKFAPNSATP